MKLTTNHIEKFKAWHEAAWQDAAWAEATRQRMKRREYVSKELVSFLDTFTTGKLQLADFKSIFDKKTRKEWDVFGLKAMSGAMFLNMMTNHLPASANISDQLKLTLPAPASEEDGLKRMSDFYNYLNSTLTAHQ